MLVDRGDRSRSSSEIAESLRPFLQNIAGCEITASASDMTAMLGGNDISVEITGDDYRILTAIADDLLREISQLEDAVDVVSSRVGAGPPGGGHYQPAGRLAIRPHCRQHRFCSPVGAAPVSLPPLFTHQ